MSSLQNDLKLSDLKFIRDYFIDNYDIDLNLDSEFDIELRTKDMCDLMKDVPELMVHARKGIDKIQNIVAITHKLNYLINYIEHATHIISKVQIAIDKNR